MPLYRTAGMLALLSLGLVLCGLVTIPAWNVGLRSQIRANRLPVELNAQTVSQLGLYQLDRQQEAQLLL